MKTVSQAHYICLQFGVKNYTDSVVRSGYTSALNLLNPRENDLDSNANPVQVADFDLCPTWLQRQLARYADSQIPVHLQMPTEIDTLEVRFNPDLLARALHNVMRNCLRYAEKEVLVACTLEGTEVVVRISDDGPGIPEGSRESIFEPFARLDTSRDRQSGGYGLGLAIARRILQRHGGNIHVENRHVHGASFVLHWPYN